MKATITGINGFIGSALNKRLLREGWSVYPMLRPDVDYVFLFGSPSSDHWFRYAMSYCFRETIGNFISAIDFCKVNKIKLIYPSSATVYEKTTPYSKCKAILDDIASCYDNILGLRIFAGYGPGEGHKEEYASIVYKFVNSIVKGERPEIWGDGTQSRDFIFIDDIVDAILESKQKTGFVDIGTGKSTSFNKVIEIINKMVPKRINPIYLKRPDHYIEETVCLHPCAYKISLEEGIKRILNNL